MVVPHWCLRRCRGMVPLFRSWWRWWMLGYIVESWYFCFATFKAKPACRGGLINPFLFFWRVGYYDRWMMQCDTTTTRLLYWPLNKHDQSIKTCFLQKFQKSGCFESHGPIRKSLDEIFPKAKGSCLRKNLIRRQELILILLLGETHEIWQLLELGLTGKNRTTDFFEGFFLIR